MKYNKREFVSLVLLVISMYMLAYTFMLFAIG